MHKTETASRYWLYVVQVVILAVVYFGAAKLGLSLASVKGIVTLVWPPTGIALAALLLFGYRLWPGVALGAFWVNVEAGASVAAVGISAGNTLEAVAGAYLLHRCVGFRNSLERLRDVLGLVGLAAVVSTMISATMGAASLGLSGVIPWTAFGSTWWVWWLGDALGILLVAPVLLTWGTNFHVDRQLPRLLEAITLLVSLVIVSQIVFSGWLASYVVTTAPLPFTLFPFLVWAALRFGQRGAVTTTLIGTGIAVWGTAHGVGPFVLETVHLSLIFLSSFTSAAAVTAMLLAAAISERKRVEEVLRDQGERYRIITELMSDYAFAYRVEPDGTFIEEWATVDSLKRITGFAPEEIGTTFILYHPEEQERANCDVKAVIEGKPSDGEYRIITKSGELRWMHISRRPICDSQQARVVRFYGIAKDITERKQSEEALRRSEEKYRLVVESSLQGVNIFQNRRIVFVNPAVCQIMGYSAAELTSFSLEQILATVHPEDRALAIERNHARLQGQPVSPHYEYRIVRRDGAVRWLETSTTPMLYEGEPGLLSISLDITERKQAEAALRESEARYRSLFEDAPISLWEEDFSAVKAYMDRLQSQGVADFGAYFESHPEVVTCCLTMIKIIDVNKSTLELYQATSKEEFFGDLTQFFDQRSYEVFKEELIAIAQGNTKVEFETVNYTLKGNRKEIILTWFVCPGYEETFSKVLVSIIDVTERKLLEEQLRQAQKMEAIGRLAGGVAHDFNNILTVIKGYAALLLQNLDVHDPLSKDIGQIQKSAERAAALTHQLLAFSRKQVLQPIVLDFNAIVTNMNEMLRRLIGEDIHLTTILDPALGRVKADPGQIEQMIINLAANARDAMPEGGKLTIETKNVYLDEAYARQQVGVNTGPYIMLAVSDTGSGMDEETRSHIFEPFFTTKEQGKGTGLGLATMHGIVNQSGGHIWVYSKPGQGTTFKVYLPQVEEASPVTNLGLQSTTSSGPGSEIILLVEDEASVRELACRALLNEGYIVLEASHGEEAIQVAQQHQGSIDLLVTDVVMPGGMSGRQLAERLTLLRQEMKVLYMSGYTDNAIIHHGVLDAGIAFLQKPFTPSLLASKVREILDTPQKV